MEVNAESLKDSASLGNLTPFVNMLKLAVRNNKGLCDKERRRALRSLTRWQKTITDQSLSRVFE